MAKMTNMDYLKQMIETNMSVDYGKEALEWLDGVELDHKKQLDAAAKDFEHDIDELKEELRWMENSRDDAQSELENLKEEQEYDCVINTRLGANDNIRWEAGNLSAKSTMEELKEAIERGVPMLKIENVLRAL